ncbi:hypothetical protein MKK50_15165 [Methylobacterium sp. J-043]|nr:hypothetical protein [Methylobacterium sp. J-043]
MFDLVEIAPRQENEERLAARIFVDLRDACAIVSPPELVVSANKLRDEKRLIHSTIAMRESFEEDRAAFEIVRQDFFDAGATEPDAQTATMNAKVRSV